MINRDLPSRSCPACRCPGGMAAIGEPLAGGRVLYQCLDCGKTEVVDPCGAVLRNRRTGRVRRCRRPAEKNGWCEKHGPVFDAARRHHAELVELATRTRRRP